MNDFVMNSSTKLEEEVDNLGTSRLRDTGIHDATIEVAYLSKSKGGALAFNLRAKTPTGDIRETIYFTNKKGDNFSVRDGKEYPMIGYSRVNAICLLTVGKPLDALLKLTETKVINIWDFTTRKEVPTDVPTFTHLCGKVITLGILRIIENKQKLGGDGKYHDTADTREINKIDRIFRTKDGLTVAEIKAKEKEPKFKAKWEEKYPEGVVLDYVKKVANSVAASSGSVETEDEETDALFSD